MSGCQGMGGQVKGSNHQQAEATWSRQIVWVGIFKCEVSRKGASDKGAMEGKQAGEKNNQGNKISVRDSENLSNC